ncbi:MAG: CoA-transferase subunit beta [Chloroflexi bacterium]|nr:CoA-transferase subunit beta [Chloroflexota bacterium]GIW11777.1 MAG: 3-oxoadipate--succinyl-CoA transferase subunit B [Dehalococcoidia bacterium]
MTEFTRTELMVVAAARELRDGEVVFVGVGIPTLATILAKRTHAPNLCFLTESGVVGGRPSRLPLSIADPCLVTGAQAICSTVELFALYLQRGHVDVGFLGGAQVDKYGNLNSTVIGPYARPQVRFPGSGGACEIASLAQRTLIIMPQGRRRFVEKVDFITSPGFLSGGNARAKVGLPGGGPSAVVSDLGLFRFDPLDREMYLASIHPGVTVEQVRAQTGWDLRVAEDLPVTPPPTEEELRIVRELDPTAHFLSREG